MAHNNYDRLCKASREGVSIRLQDQRIHRSAKMLDEAMTIALVRQLFVDTNDAYARSPRMRRAS